jgi:hypothetical protein
MGGGGDLVPLPVSADAAARAAQYAAVAERVDSLLSGETDWVAAQTTVACELHHAFECASRISLCACRAAAEQGFATRAPRVRHARSPGAGASQRSVHPHARASVCAPAAAVRDMADLLRFAAPAAAERG